MDREVRQNTMAIVGSKASIVGSEANRGVSFPSTFLITLFAKFDDRGISYCLLRNFEDLPDEVEDDVDILVRPEDLQVVEATVNSLLTDFIVLVRRTKRNGHLLFHLASIEEMKRAGKEGRPAAGVLLDFQTQLQWMGIAYMDPQAVLVQRKRYRNFYVAGLQYRASHVLCHALLDKGYFKTDYRETINRSMSLVGKGALVPLTPFIGDSMTTRLHTWLLEVDVEQILTIRRALILRLLVHRRGSIPSLIAFLGRKYMRIARAILFPPGVLVATAGPDGVGKSTLITQLGMILSETIGPVKEQYMGWRQSVLPTKRLIGLGLIVLAHWKTKKTTTSHSGPMQSPIVAQSLSNLHYFLDLWARYLFQIRPALMRGSLVLCDRYFYDILVNDIWLSKNPVTRSLLLAMIPQPTITVLFKGDPEAIAARKQEISTAEVNRQLAEFSRLRSGIGVSMELDAEQPLNDNVAVVIAAVVEKSARSGVK